MVIGGGGIAVASGQIRQRSFGGRSTKSGWPGKLPHGRQIDERAASRRGGRSAFFTRKSVFASQASGILRAHREGTIERAGGMGIIALCFKDARHHHIVPRGQVGRQGVEMLRSID